MAGANGTAATAMAVPVFSQTLTSDQNFFICVAAVASNAERYKLQVQRLGGTSGLKQCACPGSLALSRRGSEVGKFYA